MPQPVAAALAGSAAPLCLLLFLLAGHRGAAPPAADADDVDWFGVIGTGQSLSVGVQGRPVLSTEQLHGNLKLDDPGPDPRFAPGSEDRLRLVPLVEPIRAALIGYAGNEYPNNIYGETPHTRMADLITVLSQRDRGRPQVTVHSAVGWSGHALRDLDRQGPGRAYPGSLMEARAVKRLADQQGKRLAYGAVVLTHGESDWSNEEYGAQLHQLAQDYDRDLRAITGQRRGVVLLATQQSTFPGARAALPRSAVALWLAGVRHPGQIVCVGPRYQYPYAADRLHMPAAAYGRLGDKYAQIFHEVVVLRRPWRPLQPLSAARRGATVTVQMHAPVPPLAFEETLAPPHQAQHTAWARGRGFEVSDADGPVTILDAALRGDAVELRLSRAPGADAWVRYAMTQDSDDLAGGLPEGRRGQLRDSDPFVGLDAQTAPCLAQAGSVVLRCSGLRGRLPGDRAGGAGVAADAVIRAVDDAGQVTLSAPYTGQSGAARVTFHHDQRNYAVHFELRLP